MDTQRRLRRRRIRAVFEEQSNDPKPPENQAKEPLNSSSSGEGIVGAGTNFAFAAGGLFFQTISLVSVIGAAISTLISVIPVLVVLAILSAFSVVWIDRHDFIIEELEYGLTDIIYPIYQAVAKDFVELLILVYKYLVCWYDIIVGYFFIIYREVVFPIALEGGIQDVLTNLLTFIRVVLFEAVSFLARMLSAIGGVSTVQNGIRLDFTEITTSFQATWGAWQGLVCFACGTLCKVLRTLPIFPTIILIASPIPNVLPLLPFIAGDQISDDETWRALGNGVNAALELVQIFLRLIWDLLFVILLPVTDPNLRPPFNRPNLRPLGDLICESVAGVVRSVENSLQRFWDCFELFPFRFDEWLCIVDTAVCAVVKIAIFALHLIIHIDEIINFPMNPYWGVEAKQDWVEILNLIAEPANMVRIFDRATGTSPLQPFTSIPVVRGENGPNPEVLFNINTYFVPPTSGVTPDGFPSRTQGKRRVAECLGVFIQRALCDPRVNETVCFEVDDGGIGAAILNDFDLAKVSNALGRLIVDILALGFELTLHIDFANEPDAFFLFMDKSPFEEILKEDILQLLEAVLDIFTIIPPPELGECLRDLVLEIVRFVTCIALFAGQYVLGLSTLPYFLINAETRSIKDTPNFITRTDESLNTIISIFNTVVDRSNSRSFISCISRLINQGFPVPPIPCSNCTVIAFQDASILVPNPTPPTTGSFQEENHKNEEGRLLVQQRLFPYGRLMAQHPEDRLFDPYSMLNDVFGYRKEWDIRDKDTAGLRMTPLRYYKPPEALKKGYNPFVLSRMLWSNHEKLTEQFNGNLGRFLNAGETRRFMRARKEEVLEHWRTRGSCSALRNKEWRMTHSSDPQDRKDYLLQRMRGNFMPLKDGTCPKPREGEQSPNDVAERFKLFPTDASLSTCGNVTAGILPPACFDLACVVRTSLELAVHLLSLVARFFNGLIQGKDPNQKLPGESDYGYFTGEFCDRTDLNEIKPCFESDIIILVRSVVLPLKCLCEFINLIIPVLENNPRGDLCCAIQRVGELVACIVELLVNAINALAMGEDTDPTESYAYYKTGEFQRDIARVFVVVEGVAECICVFIRGIFPGNFFEDFTETIEFDPCCFVEAILDAIIETVQLELNIVISLATLAAGSPESYCYWRVDADRCVGLADFGPDTDPPDGTISTVGFVQDVIRVLNALLPDSNTECRINCQADPGMGGVVPCTCQIINALIPIRNDASRPISCKPEDLNCAILDFCCPIVRGGFALKAGIRFAVEAFASLWQSWDPGYPEFFTAYIFCDETADVYGLPAGWGETMMHTTPGDSTPLLTPMNVSRGTFVCGKLNPVIDALVGGEGIINRCLCEYFQLLDWLLNQFFGLILGPDADPQWGNCFCGRAGNLFGDDKGTGFNSECPPVMPGEDPTCDAQKLLLLSFTGSNSILGAISYLAETIIKAIVTLLRRLPDPTYWSPMGSVDNGKQGVLSSLEESWIFMFLGPIADAACLALGNMICFLNSLFFLNPNCIDPGKRFLGGIVRWVFEVIIRVVAFIEGFFKQLAGDPDEECPTGNCGSNAGGNAVYGIRGDALGAAIVAIFSIPVDILIGDGSLSCSGICTERVLDAVDGLGPCACYNRGIELRPNKDYIKDNYPLLTEVEVQLRLFDWWRPDNATNPTQCVAFMDSAPNAVYADPARGYCTSMTSCDPQPLCNLEDCIERFICRPAEMPTCGQHPGTPSTIANGVNRFDAIDGILVGFLRYLQCVAGAVGVIFAPLRVLLSIVWQIAGGILNFIASIVIFFFSLFFFLVQGNPLGALRQLTNVFASFIAIFQTPINVPPLVSRDVLKRNTFADLQNMSNFGTDETSNVFEVMADVIFEYETDMCFEDLNACVCSNMNVPTLCNDTHRDHVTDTDIIIHLTSAVFTGRSTCDMDVGHISQMYEGNSALDWRTDVPFVEKKIMIDCLEKRIKGDRAHLVMSSIPADYFYNHKGPLKFLHQLGMLAKEYLQTEAQAHTHYNRDERQRFATRFPNFRQRLKDRRNKVANHMIRVKGMNPSGLMFDAIVGLDQAWYKYRRGYYGYIFERGMLGLKRARFGTPPVGQAAQNVLKHARHAARVMYHQPYAKLIDDFLVAKREATRVVKEAFDVGPRKMLRDYRERMTRNYARSEHGRRLRENRKRFAEAMAQTPLVRFWNYGNAPDPTQGDLTPFQRYWRAMPIVSHMQRVWDFQERHRESNPDAYFAQGFWGFPTQMRRKYDAIKRGLSKRFTAPPLNEEQLHLWKHLESFVWQTQERVFPGSTPKSKRDFLLTKSCRIIDDTVAETIRLVSYCAAGYSVNRPGQPQICLDGDCNRTRRESVLPPWRQPHVKNLLKRYRETIRPSRRRRAEEEGRQHGRMSAPIRIRPESDYVWEPMPMAKRDNIPGAMLYRRLRSDTRQHQARNNRHWKPGKVDRRVWRRAVTFSSSTGRGPTGLNLYDSVLTFLEDLLEVDMSQDVDTLFMSVMAWFTNPNVEVEDVPNVGFPFYFSFTFNCRYFENLDCGIGLGLEEALRIVLKYYFLVLIIGGIFAPGLLAPILPVGSFIVFVVVIPAVAWFYSPQCWFMTPTIPMASIQLPIFPFPVSFPALPFCVGEELKFLLNKYIAPCYEFLIPNYWVNGPICPAPGQRIDIVNCKRDVGVSDGLQNILYLGYRYIGSGFTDLVMTIVSTGLGTLFPFVREYVDRTFASFENASPTQMSRQLDCAFITLTSLALPLLIAIPAGIVLGLGIMALIQWGGALIGLLRASPLAAVGSVFFPNQESPWLTLPQDDAAKGTRTDPSMAQMIGGLIESFFIRRAPKKKKKRKQK